MRATWDGNAHHFLSDKSARNEGVLWYALPSHPGKITLLQFNSAFRQRAPALLPESVGVCSGYFISQPRQKGRLEKQKPTTFGEKKVCLPPAPPPPLLFCVLVCTIVLSLLFEVVAEKSRPSLGASGKNVNTMNLKSKIRLSPFCFSLSREGEESAPYIQPFKCDVLRYRLGEPKHRSANIDSLFI